MIKENSKINVSKTPAKKVQEKPATFTPKTDYQEDLKSYVLVQWRLG